MQRAAKNRSFDCSLVIVRPRLGEHAARVVAVNNRFALSMRALMSAPSKK
jgi:hypothetical protein